jgi:hypothetical protein
LSAQAEIFANIFQRFTRLQFNPFRVKLAAGARASARFTARTGRAFDANYSRNPVRPLKRRERRAPSSRLANCRALCYSPRMTETLTIRLPKSLARNFRAKTRAAKTNPTEILRQAAANYVRDDQSARNAMVEHIRARAGTWDGDISGEELLRRTRP